MRPVDKGLSPGTFTSYDQAKPTLTERIGDYCSYCERQIETNLAIEHVRPKSLDTHLGLEWSNFLLGCANCNSSKGDSPVDIDDFLWPDTENTIRAFSYNEGGIVEPALGLSPELEAKAWASIRLTGLDKYPGNPNKTPTKADQRWLRRLEALTKARRARNIVNGNDTPETRELAVEVCMGKGMLSIWYTVFEGDADMRRRLIEAFPGTAPDCFDANADPVARPGGKL